MAMFWMIGSSLPSMQCLIELGEAKPSRFDFINNHSINVFRYKLLMEHRQERSQSYNGAPVRLKIRTPISLKLTYDLGKRRGVDC
jgi:hypothetical protein